MNGVTDIFIAADGGGTRSGVLLVAGDARVEVTGGPANVTSDPEGAIFTISELIQKAAFQAGISDLTSARAYLALAGVLDESHGAELAMMFPFGKVRVSHDRFASVAGAIGDADGAVIGIGTGSFLGRQTHGQITLIGGWGLVLGDEASGAYIGRAALQAVLKAAEGQAHSSDLIRTLDAEYGGEAGVIRFANDATPAQLAALAPRITDAARAGDPVARAILEDGARYIELGLDHLGWVPGERLCLLGGLARDYLPYLPARFANHVSDPDGTALDGALSLARKMG